MSLPLPLACIVLLLLVVTCLIFHHIQPEQILAEPRPGQMVELNGKLMKQEDASLWLSQREKLTWDSVD